MTTSPPAVVEYNVPRPSPTVTATRRAPRAVTPRAKAPVVDPTVTCVFCKEPIELSSFTLVGRNTCTASCPNCGLQVSVGAPQWAMWCRTPATSGDGGLGERLRARRVAIATRRILDRVSVTADPFDGPA